MDSFVKLGPIEAVRILGSYVKARARAHPAGDDLRPVGERTVLVAGFSQCFSSRTRKRSGAFRCDEISADWAAQRNQGAFAARGDPRCA